MRIPDGYREKVVDDLDFALSKMKETQDIGELLFFFSAFYGAIHRALNYEYDQDLVFAHNILKTTHETMIGRYKAFSSGNEKNVPMFDEQFKALIRLSSEFVDKIANNKNADSVLKKMAVLGFSTTGNGFYLYSKGLIKL